MTPTWFFTGFDTVCVHDNTDARQKIHHTFEVLPQCAEETVGWAVLRDVALMNLFALKMDVGVCSSYWENSYKWIQEKSIGRLLGVRRNWHSP